jgi:hypothetical protein
MGQIERLFSENGHLNARILSLFNTTTYLKLVKLIKSNDLFLNNSKSNDIINNILIFLLM